MVRFGGYPWFAGHVISLHRKRFLNSDYALIMSRAEPKVTVLIPTFNRARYLPQCLDSILGQTLKPYQVILVNDGSTDDTRDVIKPYRDRIDYAEIENKGKSNAVNHGLLMATGDYVWIFDDDDVVIPDAIERFVAPLEEWPEYDYSFSTFFVTRKEEGDDGLGAIVRESMIPDLESRGPLIPLLEANYLGGAAIFTRRSCYDRVGGYDTDLVRSQDYEMAIRLTRAFKGVRVQGGPTFYLRRHQESRGSLRDRFPAAHQKTKWLQYGQVIFRRLHKELPLEDYLPPGSCLKEERRQALLQRLAIMACKLLVSEVIEDLEELKQLNSPRPFSDAERKIIAKMVLQTPWQSETKLFDTLSFQAGINNIIFSNKNAVMENTQRIMGIKNITTGISGLFEALLASAEPTAVIDLLLYLIRRGELDLCEECES